MYVVEGKKVVLPSIPASIYWTIVRYLLATETFLLSLIRHSISFFVMIWDME
jgi:hypothetical protein